jgi:ABC-2 type transport system ATP-binding protein
LTPSSSAIRARGLGLRTGAGWVYRRIDLEVPAGALAVVTGPARSGKTALLLTLAARMKAGEGDLVVAGVDARRRPGAVRHLTGLGEFRGVNDLDDTLTVSDQVMAELALHGRPWRGAHVETVLEPLGLQLEHRRTVRTLSAGERLLLGAALGFITRPPVLILDELDEDTTPQETAAVLDALRALSAAGVTIVAGTLDPGLAPAADVSLTLGADGSPEPGAQGGPASQDDALSFGQDDASGRPSRAHADLSAIETEEATDALA